MGEIPMMRLTIASPLNSCPLTFNLLAEAHLGVISTGCRYCRNESLQDLFCCYGNVGKRNATVVQSISVNQITRTDSS